jgi:hypothetical protein
VRDVPLRVVIIGLPQLVTDVLVYACNWPGHLEVAAAVPEGQLTSETDAELVIMTHQPDVIVVRADEGALDRIADLRMRHCHQVVVGIAPDGSRAWNVELHTELATVEPVSQERLRALIQSAAGASA